MAAIIRRVEIRAERPEDLLEEVLVDQAALDRQVGRQEVVV